MNSSYKKGFSLIETIVYIAVFSVLSIIVINSYAIIVGSFSNIRSTHDLLESGNVAMERMTREINKADSIDIVNSTFGSDLGVLQLNGDQVTKFYVSNGDLFLSYDDVLVGSLISNNTQVANLIFRRITTLIGEGVKIELTIQDIKNQRSENFYNTIILRSSY
ncbi:MAG: prepilin-type N-terminal cleavage/methylation domain-containing protein [Patescibacteria group bacterium]|nr:prepilin-type N-terminal cleavage/methylation domain-containing protein [Patescibacteria group bacterium]